MKIPQTSAKDRLIAMIRNLHKQNLLDNPNYRRTLIEEADKARISEAQLDRLIAEVINPSVVEEPAKTPEPVVAEPEHIEPQEDKKNKKPYLIIAAAVIVVAVVLVWLLSDKPIEPPKVEEPTNIEQPIVQQPKNDEPKTENPVAEPSKPDEPIAEPPKNNPPQKGNLDYGNFDGKIINGEPDGYGNLLYSKEHILNRNDLEKRKAMPGDKVEGEFKNGNLIQGEIIRKDGSHETLLIGG